MMPSLPCRGRRAASRGHGFARALGRAGRAPQAHSVCDGRSVCMSKQGIPSRSSTCSVSGSVAPTSQLRKPSRRRWATHDRAKSSRAEFTNVRIIPWPGPPASSSSRSLLNSVLAFCLVTCGHRLVCDDCRVAISWDSSLCVFCCRASFSTRSAITAGCASNHGSAVLCESLTLHEGNSA